VHEHAASIKFIADLAGLVATALSIIAIAISFIPVLNLLSPILLGVAAGFTVVALACHMMLALSAARAGLRTATRKALAAAKKQAMVMLFEAMAESLRWSTQP
jgi:hypothetical protein